MKNLKSTAHMSIYALLCGLLALTGVSARAMIHGGATPASINTADLKMMDTQTIDNKELFYKEQRIGNISYADSTATRYIVWMWVDDDYRNRGCGRFALQAIENSARSKGLKRLELNAVPQSVSFYQNYGFQEMGDQDNTMTKELACTSQKDRIEF